MPGIPPRFCASKLIEGDKNIEDQLELNKNELELLEHCIVEMEDESKLDRNAALADMRYDFIEKVVAISVVKCHESREHKRSVKIDRILTGKYTALPVFFRDNVSCIFPHIQCYRLDPFRLAFHRYRQAHRPNRQKGLQPTA